VAHGRRLGSSLNDGHHAMDLQPDTLAGGILHTKISRLEAAEICICMGRMGDRLGRTELRHNLAPIDPARDRPGLT